MAKESVYICDRCGERSEDEADLAEVRISWGMGHHDEHDLCMTCSPALVQVIERFMTQVQEQRAIEARELRITHEVTHPGHDQPARARVVVVHIPTGMQVVTEDYSVPQAKAKALIILQRNLKERGGG